MEILERKVTNELVTAQHSEGGYNYKFNASLTENSTLQRVDGTIEKEVEAPTPKGTPAIQQVGSFNYNETETSVRLNKEAGLTNTQASTVVDREIENLKALLNGEAPASKSISLEEEAA